MCHVSKFLWGSYHNYPLKFVPCVYLSFLMYVPSYCEILKYSQVYEPYRSIVGQERGRTHRDLYERRKINQILTKLILI